MADNTTLNSGTGGDTIATDDIGGVKHQRVKVQYGVDGAATDVSDTNPLPIDDAGGSITVDGSVSIGAALPAGTNNIGDVDVLTAPATAADGAAGLPAVTKVVAGYDGTNVQALATDSSGILQVDVVGDSTTQAGAAARTADYDTGAGTATTVMNGLALPASGGPVAGGTSSNPVRTDPTGTTTQPVSGTVTANAGSGTFTVDTELPAAGALADGASNPTTSVIGAFLQCFNGTTWDRARGDTTNGIDVDVTRVSGNVTVVNGGTFATQESGGALTALQLIDDTVFTDDAAFTVGTSKVNAIGLLADQASTDSVNEGDVGIPRMTLDRKQIATLAPSSDTEGLSIFRSLDLDETEEEVKATAGKVYGYTFFNAAASTRYLKFYNATAANVTVGTTTPVITVGLPAGAAGHIPWDMGIGFGTAITAAVTTGIADADTGAPGANDVSINIFYV